ncbi:MAG: site-2 protease family protein [Dehalococcoidia bacterium]|nr:site-2 protease family protein [Dehalococcoidia bacterium]
MLLFNLDLLRSDPTLFLVVMLLTGISLLLAITVHEFSHAALATKLGDPTARRDGRLTLNPLAHLDPAGAVLLLLVGFGWGKPVQVNPNNLSAGAKAGMALVALAGPASNFITAGLFSIPLRFDLIPQDFPGSFPFTDIAIDWTLLRLLRYIIMYNLILGVFNLIPLAPLDGFKVVLGLLPRTAAISFSRLEQYGPVILMIIVGLGYFTDLNILGQIISPTVGMLARLIVGRPL